MSYTIFKKQLKLVVLLLSLLLISNFTMQAISLEKIFQIGGSWGEKVLFSKDGSELLGLREGSLLVYDSENGNFKKIIASNYNCQISANEDKTIFALASYSEYIVYIINSDGELIQKNRINLPFMYLKLSRDGKKYYLYFDDHYSRYDVLTNKLENSKKFSNKFQFAFLSEYGEYFGGNFLDSIYIYNTTTNEKIGSYYVPENICQTDKTTQFSLDNSLWCYLTWDSVVHVVDISTKKERPFKLRDLITGAISYKLSNDNRYIAFINTYSETGLNIIDLSSGKYLESFDKPDKSYIKINPSYPIEFSPSGKSVVFNHKSGLSLFDIESGEKIFEIPNIKITGAYDFSTTEDSLISIKDHKTQFYDIKKSGKFLGSIEGNCTDGMINTPVSSLDHTGKYFFTTRKDGYPPLKWDLENESVVSSMPDSVGQCVKLLPIPGKNELIVFRKNGEIRRLNTDTWENAPGFPLDLKWNETTRLTKDGSKLFTCYNLQNNYFLDAATGDTLSSFNGNLPKLDLSRDGSKILTFSIEGKLVQLDMSGKILSSPEIYQYGCNSIYLDNDTKILAFNGNNYGIYDANTFQMIDEFKFPLVTNISVYEQDPDKILITDNEKNINLVYSIKRKTVTDIIRGPVKYNIKDDSTLYTIKSSTMINKWNPAKEYVNKTYLTNKSFKYKDIKSMGDDKRIFLFTDKEIYILDRIQNILIDSIDLNKKHEAEFLDVEYNQNNQTIIALANLSNVGGYSRHKFFVYWDLADDSQKFYFVSLDPYSSDVSEISINRSSGNIIASLHKSERINEGIVKINFHKYKTDSLVVLSHIAIPNLSFKIYDQNDLLIISGVSTLYLYKLSDFSLIDSFPYHSIIDDYDINYDATELAFLQRDVQDYLNLTRIDLSTGKLKEYLPLGMTNHLYGFSKMRFTPNGKRILIHYHSEGYPAKIGVYNVDKNSLDGSILCDLDAVGFEVLDNSYILTTGNYGLLYEMDLNRTQPLKIISMPGLKNYDIVNYPQSYYLITSEDRYDNKLFFYDISGKLKFTYDLFEFGYKILFHPLKQRFLANHEIDYSNYYYTEYDINTKEITPHYGYNVMGYSHTGNSYGIFNEKEICAFWDDDSLPHSRIPYNSNLKEWEKDFAISPEGKMIAARYEYNKIHIFNTITNKEINTIDIIDYGKFGFIPNSSVLWMYSGFYLKFVNPLTGVKLDSIKISEGVINKDGSKIMIYGNGTLDIYKLDFSDIGNIEDNINSAGNDKETLFFNLYPNPSSDYIDLHLDDVIGSEAKDLKIYNSLGECVINESIHPMTSSHRMNIEHLPPGLYFININNGKEMLTASFIVLR